MDENKGNNMDMKKQKITERLSQITFMMIYDNVMLENVIKKLS